MPPVSTNHISMRKFSDSHKTVTRSGEKLNVPLDLVHVEPNWNVRKMNDRLRAHLDWLKASILAKGIEDDLWGYPVEVPDPETGELIKKMRPLNGHNRYAAVVELYNEGHTNILIPFVYKPKMSEEDRKALILSSNSGLPLTALEKAEVVRELHAKGWTVEKIAANYAPGEEDLARFGNGDTMSKIKRKIEWLLTLASADTATKELVNQEKAAPSNVVAAIKAFGNDPDLGSKAVQATHILADAEGKTTKDGKITSSQTQEIIEQLLELDNPEVVLDTVIEAKKEAEDSGLPVIECLPDDLPIGNISLNAGRQKNTSGFNGRNPERKQAKKKLSSSSLTTKAAFLWNVMETQFEGEGAKLLDVVQRKDITEKVKLLPKGDYAFYRLADGKVCILPFDFLNTLAIASHKGGNLNLNLQVIEEEEPEEAVDPKDKNLIVVAKR